MEVIDEKAVSWAEAKKILEKKSKEKELGYEQKNALEHLKKFSKLGIKKEQQLAEGLKGMDKLKDRQVVSLLDILPQTEDEIKLLFAKEVINLSEDERKKIAGTIKKLS